MSNLEYLAKYRPDSEQVSEVFNKHIEVLLEGSDEDIARLKRTIGDHYFLVLKYMTENIYDELTVQNMNGHKQDLEDELDYRELVRFA